MAASCRPTCAQNPSVVFSSRGHQDNMLPRWLTHRLTGGNYCPEVTEAEEPETHLLGSCCNSGKSLSTGCSSNWWREAFCWEQESQAEWRSDAAWSIKVKRLLKICKAHYRLISSLWLREPPKKKPSCFFSSLWKNNDSWCCFQHSTF